MILKEYDFNLPVRQNGKPLDISARLNSENMLRLNPHWNFKKLITDQDGFSAEIVDHATDKEFSLKGTLQHISPQDISLTLENGDITSIRISPDGDTFKACVTYCTEQIDETVEYFVIMWLRSIKQYLRLYHKRTINTLFFRFLMNRIILTMNPSQRKICLMLVRLTVLEVIVIVLIIAGYFFFRE